MEQSNNLSQKQELKQVMTLAPQQLHSLSLLTLPVMELEARIEEELAVNPVLELEPGGAGEEEKKTDSPEEEGDGDGDERFSDPMLSDSASGGEYSKEDMLDPNREDYEDHLGRIIESPEDWDSPQEDEERRNYIFDSIVAETSLQEYLLEQLRFADVKPGIRSCAEYIIGSLDGNGYLQGALADAAQSSGTDMNGAEEALALVQSFDPPGIAARDLRESLLLQLHARQKHDPQLETLIREHFDELARNKLPQIARSMDITVERLNELVADLRLLNPYPGATVAQTTEPYVLPELTVVPEGDSFVLLENDPPFGRLSISKYYAKMLENPALAAEDRAYLRGKIDSGKMLIHNLEQRKKTIRRIGELILNSQYDFMKYGPRALKPMTMQQAADKLGLHETTISRAVSGKYIQTPVGLFEFKYFFSGGFQSEEGEELSAHAIKNMIREFVANEDPAKPLSDSRLSDLLKERGFEVARRTVAKYREELGIQSSQLRKTF